VLPILLTFWFILLYRAVSYKNFHWSITADQKEIIQDLLILGAFNCSGKTPLQTIINTTKAGFQ
jgi:hypothetical protein